MLHLNDVCQRGEAGSRWAFEHCVHFDNSKYVIHHNPIEYSLALNCFRPYFCRGKHLIGVGTLNGSLGTANGTKTAQLSRHVRKETQIINSLTMTRCHTTKFDSFIFFTHSGSRIPIYHFSSY